MQRARKLAAVLGTTSSLETRSACGTCGREIIGDDESSDLLELENNAAGGLLCARLVMLPALQSVEKAVVAGRRRVSRNWSFPPIATPPVDRPRRRRFALLHAYCAAQRTVDLDVEVSVAAQGELCIHFWLLVDLRHLAGRRHEATEVGHCVVVGVAGRERENGESVVFKKLSCGGIGSHEKCKMRARWKVGAGGSGQGNDDV